MMLEAARIYKEPRYRQSAEKGGQFILLAQMPDPQPAWAQQYDAAMHPAWARVFEPPSVTGGESQGIMRILMTLYRETGDRKYLEPIPRALDYLKRSIVPRGSQEIFRRIPNPARCWRASTNLQTNKPLYITKGTRIIAAGLGSRAGGRLRNQLLAGFGHHALRRAGQRRVAVRPSKRTTAAWPPQDPSSHSPPRAPARPLALERAAARPRPQPAALAAEARRLIDSLDPRGAWTRMGTIGKRQPSRVRLRGQGHGAPHRPRPLRRLRRRHS